MEKHDYEVNNVAEYEEEEKVEKEKFEETKHIKSEVAEDLDNLDGEEFFDMQQKEEKDNILRDAYRFLFDTDEQINKKIDTNDRGILAYARADLIAEIFNIKPLKMYVKSLKTLSISKDRKGRDEAIKLAQHFREELGFGSGYDAGPNPSILSNLFGKG